MAKLYSCGLISGRGKGVGLGRSPSDPAWNLYSVDEQEDGGRARDRPFSLTAGGASGGPGQQGVQARKDDWGLQMGPRKKYLL